MERRKALALASTATLVLGSGVVAAVSATGMSLLGFGGGASTHRTSAIEQASGSQPGVVLRTRNVYDRYVVDTGDAPSDSGGGGNQFGAPGASAIVEFPTTTATDPTTNVATPTTVPANRGHDPRTAPTTTPTTRPGSAAPTTVAPTTVPASPTTTIPSTTSTTWPPGVPKDWPKDKPIPPMPPNCRDPQLEDNGVWNCDH